MRICYVIVVLGDIFSCYVVDNLDFDLEMVSFDIINLYFGLEEKLVNLRYFCIFVKRVLIFFVYLREREKIMYIRGFFYN